MDFLEREKEWGNMLALRVAAEGLIDATQKRISTTNRVKRAGVADELLGQEMIDADTNLEKTHQKILRQAYKEAVPEDVRNWAKAIPGLGEGVLFPKLVALIGNPVIATPWRWEGKDLVPDGEPYYRTLQELLAYAGRGDPERRPRKNMTQEELLACGKRKQVGPLLHTFSSYLQISHQRSEAVANSRYWATFVKAKEAGLEKRHVTQCQNHKRPPATPDGCGTAAHPEWGEPGSLWRPGHAQGHAHRMVGKKLLEGLWRVAGGDDIIPYREYYDGIPAIPLEERRISQWMKYRHQYE